MSRMMKIIIRTAHRLQIRARSSPVNLRQQTWMTMISTYLSSQRSEHHR